MKKTTIHSMVPELKDQLDKKKISRRDFIRTSSLLGLSTAAVYGLAGISVLSSTSCQGGVSTSGELRWGMALQELKDPANFNWVESSNVSRGICEYLVEVDENNIAKPYLAESWQPSEDLKTWDFYLKKGVTFNNGDEFNAEHVIYNFDRWRKNSSKSINKTIFKDVEDVEKIDAHHIKIHLKNSKLSLPEDLYQYTTAIMHKNFDDEGADLAKFPVGTGPFTLESYQVGDKAELKRREDYWGEKALLEKVTVYDLGTDLQAYFNALKSNQIDFAHNLDREQIPLLAEDGKINLLRTKSNKTFCMRMKVTKKPFNDIRVRKAVVLASDNQKLLDVIIQGNGVVAQNDHISPTHPEYAKTPATTRNIDEAKRLLAEAGYPNGIDLEISVGNTQGKYEQDACVQLKQQCAEAGIKIKINVLPTAQYWEIWDKADFSLTFWAHRPLGVMVYNLAYATGAIWNETEFSNAEFDSKLKEANGIVDPQERSKVMKDLQVILQDNAVMVQPFWEDIMSAASKQVKNLKLHPTQYTRMDKVYIDKA